MGRQVRTDPDPGESVGATDAPHLVAALEPRQPGRWQVGEHHGLAVHFVAAEYLVRVVMASGADAPQVIREFAQALRYPVHRYA